MIVTYTGHTNLLVTLMLQKCNAKGLLFEMTHFSADQSMYWYLFDTILCKPCDLYNIV